MKNVLEIMADRASKSPELKEFYKDEKIKFLEQRLWCFEKAIEKYNCAITTKTIQREYEILVEEYERK